MFVRQNQQQFRNSNADVQIFYGDADAATSTLYRKSWNKSPGVSHVYILLIGAGGTGDGTTGGGSGSVTIWYGDAQNVPDSLLVQAARSGVQTASEIYYRGSSLITLLSSNSGLNSAGGAAITSGYPFAASGFYQSIAGQDGSSTTNTASTTTFLSGGSANGTTGNYGYTNSTSNRNGFFMLQPIIVGVGGSGNSRGGVGCGGGTSASTGLGGQGMVLIASW